MLIFVKSVICVTLCPHMAGVHSDDGLCEETSSTGQDTVDQGEGHPKQSVALPNIALCLGAHSIISDCPQCNQLPSSDAGAREGRTGDLEPGQLQLAYSSHDVLHVDESICRLSQILNSEYEDSLCSSSHSNRITTSSVQNTRVDSCTGNVSSHPLRAEPGPNLRTTNSESSSHAQTVGSFSIPVASTSRCSPLLSVMEDNLRSQQNYADIAVVHDVAASSSRGMDVRSRNAESLIRSQTAPDLISESKSLSTPLSNISSKHNNRHSSLRAGFDSFVKMIKRKFKNRNSGDFSLPTSQSLSSAGQTTSRSDGPLQNALPRPVSDFSHFRPQWTASAFRGSLGLNIRVPACTDDYSKEGNKKDAFAMTAVRAHSTVDYVHWLVPDLERITNCGFYWGVMDRYEAEALLDGKPEGTFLLRDSSQDDFLFSVSFRRYNRSLHARIEQWNCRFSFDAQDNGVFRASTVTELLEHYKDPLSCMFFEPMLTRPLTRPKPFDLLHLARAAICDRLTYDGIDRLPIPMHLQGYLRYYHYKQQIRTRTHTPTNTRDMLAASIYKSP